VHRLARRACAAAMAWRCRIGLGRGRGPERDGEVGGAHMRRQAIGLGVDGTASRPSSWQARMIRSAISPRLATNTRLMVVMTSRSPPTRAISLDTWNVAIGSHSAGVVRAARV